MAQRAEGVAKSLRSSEIQLLFRPFSRKAVNAETPPSLRDTSPITPQSCVTGEDTPLHNAITLILKIKDESNPNFSGHQQFSN